MLSTDNTFIRVARGQYTLRCWAADLPPQQPDQDAAKRSGGGKVREDTVVKITCTCMQQTHDNTQHDPMCVPH